MPSQVNIDFETRNTADIKCGASKYANTAIVLCLAYSIDGGPVKTWRPGQSVPKDLLDAASGGALFVAWNAAFERQIWRKVCVRQWGWPEVAKWKCTMAAALACGLPGSLEMAAKALGLNVEKDMAGRRLMLKMSKPRKPTKKDPSVWHDKPEDYVKLLAYCAQDVRTEMAVGEVVHDLSPTEQGVYEYDHKVNARGVKFDIPLVENCIKVWNKYVKSLNDEMQEITFGGATTSEVARILGIAQSLDTPINVLDKRAVTNAITINGISPTARRMLELRQLAAKSSVAKFKRILQCAEEDGRIRGCTQYHGARTGRFAGRLIQLQNLPRGILDEESIEPAVKAINALSVKDIEAIGPVGDVLGSMVRSSIIAEPGKKLIACDFASIEARCLAWLAGEKWLLDAYRNNEDAYKHMAASIYNVKYDEVTKDQRWWGKSLILGAGYGLGAGGLVRLLDSAGVQTKEKDAKVLIDAYREKNKAIVRYWYAIERAAVETVRSGKPSKYGQIVYHMNGRWLCCRLPSGRDIRYLDPKLVPGRFDKEQIEFTGIDITGKPVRETTYSGKLVENCIAEDTKVLTDRGWVPIQHVRKTDLVHDGITFVRHEGMVNKSIQECVEVDGVRMTPDHEVLTDDGWKIALENPRPFRPKIRDAVLHRDQQRGLLARKLPLGNSERELFEQAVFPGRGRIDSITGNGHRSDNTVLSSQERVSAKVTNGQAKCKAQVYDILNCGPRHRFVVLGTTGPFIVHNCDQAICRDLLVWAMSRLEKAGYPVVFHVHDEVVVETDNGTAEEVEQIMTEIPDWAEGFPIGAEGFECQRYRK